MRKAVDIRGVIAGEAPIGDSLREHIARTAASLFKEWGYQACTLRQVGDAVGLSKAGLYHYFPSKDAILREISIRAVEALVGHLDAVLRMDISADQQLREVVIGRVEIVADEQDFLTVFWQERAAMPPDVEVQLVGLMRDYLHRLVSLIRRAQRDGLIRRDCDVEMVAWGIIGITGWSYHWYKPGGRLSARHIGESFWQLLWEGVRSPPGEA